MSLPVIPTEAAPAEAEGRAMAAVLPLTYDSLVATAFVLATPFILVSVLKTWLKQNQSSSDKKDAAVVLVGDKSKTGEATTTPSSPKKKKTYRGRRHSKKHEESVKVKEKETEKAEKEQKGEVKGLEYTKGLPRSRAAQRGWRHSETVEKRGEMSVAVEEVPEEKGGEWTQVVSKKKLARDQRIKEKILAEMDEEDELLKQGLIRIYI